jgi:hypothetical protein
MHGHQAFAINGDLLITFDADKYLPKSAAKTFNIADHVKPSEVYKLIGFKTDISNKDSDLKVILVEN